MIAPYYQNRLVTLYHGDAFEIAADIPDGSFDMALTDPPYGLRCCKWDEPIDAGALCAMLRRTCRADAARVVFADMRLAARLVMADDEFRYDLVYRKRCPCGILNARRQPLRAHENILVFYGRSPTYNPQMARGRTYSKPARRSRSANYKGRSADIVSRAVTTDLRFPTSVLDSGYSTSERRRETVRHMGGHPTQKPVSLFAWLMRTYTKGGGAVFDPFCGSGTAGLAAMECDRRAVLIEREERYCEMAALRIQRAETLWTRAMA